VFLENGVLFSASFRKAKIDKFWEWFGLHLPPHGGGCTNPKKQEDVLMFFHAF
jgi:hypothetical protein